MNMEDPKDLMDAFPGTSKQQWIDQATRDLKGVDFDTLEHLTPDGIKIAPFYTQEDIDAEQPLFSFADWEISDSIEVEDAGSANANALKLLNNGITALIFKISKPVDFGILLKEIGIEYIALQLYIYTENAIAITQNFDHYLQSINLNRAQLNLTINYDPLEQLICTGNWRKGAQQDMEAYKAFIENNTDCRNVCINAAIYHEAGASPAYEIACMLAHANEYLALISNPASVKVQLSIAAGANYFTAIAKIRAVRKVFSLLLDSYQADNTIYIHTTSAERNLTIYDQHNNLLRTATGAMAAIAGGCNSLEVLPFDSTYKQPDEFSNRMARNIQLILKGESYFDKASDVAAGSYYIETLTEDLAQKAWTYFQDIEQHGGLIECLKKGAIQQQIEQFAAAEQALFDEGKKILVGVNKYPLMTQHMAGKMTPQETHSFGNAAIKPLKPVRLAAAAESERLANEPKAASA